MQEEAKGTRYARIVMLFRSAEKTRYKAMCKELGEDFSKHAYETCMKELQLWEDGQSPSA